MSKRRNSQQQRARRQERRQQKKANQSFQRLRYFDAISNDAPLSEKQRAQVLQGKLEVYEMNRREGEAPRLEFLTQNERNQKGALIKQYYEYVDKGWIRPQSFMDVYDAAEYMTQNVSSADMEKAIQQADEWNKITQEREERRRAERIRNRPVIPF